MGAIFRPRREASADRSAGDRLRHRQKVRSSIRDNIADIIAEESIIGRSGDKIIKVPIRGIKEYRFVYGENSPGVVWIYYGDMGASDGITSFVAEDFPSGASNVPVKAGQVIGYQGTWNDRSGWASWVHVLLGVRANGQDFPAEFTPGIVLDPRPYFNLPLLPEAESKFR